MRKLNVAILGQGRSGRDIHGNHLKNDERYKIVAVVDPLEERRIRAAGEYGCDTYSDYKELFGRTDIDLVTNATPSYLHVPITMDLIKAGFNVISEKPLARRAQEVDELIKAAADKGVLFTVFQQSRFAPYFQKIKEVIDSGVLGRIVQISISFNGFSRRWDWQCIQDYNGGNLLNTGPHPLDQALNLLDSYDSMPEIFCIMDRANTFGDAEDYVKLVLRSPGKPVIDLEISSCNAYPCFTYNVQGTNGGLKASQSHADWRYFIPAEAPEQKLIREPLTDKNGFPAYCHETLKWYEDSWDVSEEHRDLFSSMAYSYYTMIYNKIVSGTPLTITPQQVRQQIAVVEECHRQNPLSKLKD